MTIPRKILSAVSGLILAAGVVVADASDPNGDRAWLGVFLGEAVDGGVPVIALFPGGPAARGGVRSGDVVLRAGERPLLDPDELVRVLEDRSPGDRLHLEVLRTGERLKVVVELGERREPPSGTFTVEAPSLWSVPGAPAALEVHRGLRVVDMTPELRRHYGAPELAGILVTRIDPEISRGAPDLKVGDVVVRLADDRVESVSEFHRLLELAMAGTEAPLLLELVRRGNSAEALLQRPQPIRAAAPPGASAAMEQAILREIQRLESRIEELQEHLERMRRQP